MEDISEDLLKKYIGLINEWSGIYFTDSNNSVLRRKILSRVKKIGFSPEEYYQLILGNQEELIDFLDSITTNFTKFFRHKEQFDYIRYRLIPVLALKREQQGFLKIRLWSAGCATGEEPYSLVITVLESFKENNIHLNFEVIASDISLKCIELAQRGVYPLEKLSDIPKGLIDEYFNPLNDNKFAVKEELKRFVRFDFHNLLHDSGLRNIDIIMCRNVFIYMDEESILKVVENFYNSLNNDGYLFLGPTESLFGITNKFKSQKEENLFFYIKNLDFNLGRKF